MNMPATTDTSSRTQSGCLILFGLVFAIPGIAVGVSTIRKLILGAIDAKQVVLGLSIALIFAGAGIGLIVWGRFAARIAAQNRETMARNPDKPWLWRDDWAQSYARAEWKSTAGMMTVIGLGFLVLFVPMMVNLPATLLREHPFQTGLVFLLPVVGFLLVGQSVVASLRARKFKDVRLKLSSVPCVIGGKLHGTVEADFIFPPGTTIDFTVNCVRSYVSRSGSDRTRWERTLWQERQTLAIATDGRTSYAPFEITLPYDAKETDTRNPDDEILWRVTARSKLPGLDFNAIFILPVFKTEASDPTLTAAAIEAHDETLLAGERPKDSKIVKGIAPDGGLLFYFGPARNNRAAIFAGVFGSIFLGAGLFFGFAAGQAFSWILGLIPITLAGGIGLFLLVFAVWLLLGTTTVEVLNRELHIRSACLGISRSSVIPASSIQDFQLYPGLQVGEQIWYDLKLKLANGRSRTAGAGLEKTEAEWLRAELKKALAILR